MIMSTLLILPLLIPQRSESLFPWDSTAGTVKPSCSICGGKWDLLLWGVGLAVDLGFRQDSAYDISFVRPSYFRNTISTNVSSNAISLIHRTADAQLPRACCRGHKQVGTVSCHDSGATLQVRLFDISAGSHAKNLTAGWFEWPRIVGCR